MTRAGRAVLITLAIAAAGCAGRHHGRLRQLREGDAAECRYIGYAEITGRTGWSMADTDLGASAEVRQRVVEMGGNAFARTHGRSVAFGTGIQIDVYKCP